MANKIYDAFRKAAMEGKTLGILSDLEADVTIRMPPPKGPFDTPEHVTRPDDLAVNMTKKEAAMTYILGCLISRSMNIDFANNPGSRQNAVRSAALLVHDMFDALNEVKP